MADEPKKTTGVKAGQLIERYKQRLRVEKRARKEAEAERETLKGRPSTEALETRVAGYEKADKDRSYRAAFDAEAEAAGIKGRAKLDAAWRLATVDQSGDQPDAGKLKLAVGDLLKVNDFLVGAPAAAGKETPPPLAKGQGNERGQGGGAELAGKFTYTSDNLGDGDWMRENQDKLSKAMDEGRAQKVG